MKKYLVLMSAAALLAFALPASADEYYKTARVKHMVNINASGQTSLVGNLKAIGSTSVTVSSWGGDWVINFVSTTKFLRRYDGRSSLSEFKVGDAIEVKGKATTSSLWTINARSLKDNSIQTSNASFSGVISNLNTSTMTFTLTTKYRGTLQVMVNADAKVRVGEKSATLSDLANGTMVSVSGVWNTNHSTLLASRVSVSKGEMDKQKKREKADRGDDNDD